ncbi:MAG: hypothetical protein V4670_04765 [Bacteroidota bacterium]
MERRDLIEDQIEQLGTFLRNLVSSFLKLKSTKTELEVINYVSDKFKEEFNLDLNQFISFSEEELKHFITEYKLTDNHLETLSNLMLEMYSNQGNNVALSKQYLIRGIELLDLADKISITFSLNRANKKSQLKDILNEL